MEMKGLKDIWSLRGCTCFKGEGRENLVTGNDEHMV